MSIKSLGATHALLTDWIQQSKRPNKETAIELLYMISIAKEYMKRLKTVGPDVVAQLKSETPFLQYVYMTFREESPEAAAVRDYFSTVHERVLEAITNGENIESNYLPTTLAASYKSVHTRTLRTQRMKINTLRNKHD